MNRISVFNIAMTILVAVSCGRDGRKGVEMLPFVKDVLTDTSDVYNHILTSFDSSDKSGGIAIIGPTEETAMFTQCLLHYDSFDNGDGRSVSDSLPDFAGETIVPYFDIANAPYHGYVKAQNEDFLRETTVKNVLAAISDSFYANPYSNEPSSWKNPSKMIVLSSSLMSGLGYCDVDTMFSSAGKNVPLIAPVEVLVEKAYEHNDGAAVGIWAGNDALASGVYASVFHRVAVAENRPVMEYVGFCPKNYSDIREGFIKFLDMYMLAGNVNPLSALLLDDFALSGEEESLNAFAHEIFAGNDSQTAKYASLIAPDFKAVGVMSAMADECYSILRRHNLFTHRIAYPQMEAYMIVPSAELAFGEINHDGSFTDDFKYSRAAGSTVQTVKHIEANYMYMNKELLDSMAAMAPDVYNGLYVY